MKWRLPSTVELEYFLEVARTENISRASERLGVTQPSLSLAMKRLESSLGLTLLVRSKTGVQLTAQGQRLFRNGQHLLEQWQMVMNESVRSESELAGRFVVGAHPSVAHYSLTKIMHDLLLDFPNLDFRFAHGLSRLMTADVIAFKIDFAIVINPIPHPDLVMKKLGDDEVRLWVARVGAQENRIIYDDELAQSERILQRLPIKKFERSLVSGNLDVVAQLTAQGCGVGILPRRVAENSLHGGLKPWSGSELAVKDKIYLVFRRDLQLSHSAKKLSEELVRRLAFLN